VPSAPEPAPAARPASAPANPSVELLDRIRAAEQEAEERVAAARRLAEETIRRLRREAEDAVATARAEAEGERVHAVEAARSVADREAAEIVADGERAAGRLGAGDGVPAEKRAQVLATILGDFGGK